MFSTIAVSSMSTTILLRWVWVGEEVKPTSTFLKIQMNPREEEDVKMVEDVRGGRT